MKVGSHVVFIRFPKLIEFSKIKSFTFKPFTPVLEQTILTIKKLNKIGNKLYTEFEEIEITNQDDVKCAVDIFLLREVELPELPNFIEKLQTETV
jgi:hypothetical protein